MCSSDLQKELEQEPEEAEKPAQLLVVPLARLDRRELAQVRLVGLGAKRAHGRHRAPHRARQQTDRRRARGEAHAERVIGVLEEMIDNRGLACLVSEIGHTPKALRKPKTVVITSKLDGVISHADSVLRMD